MCCSCAVLGVLSVILSNFASNSNRIVPYRGWKQDILEQSDKNHICFPNDVVYSPSLLVQSI